MTRCIFFTGVAMIVVKRAGRQDSIFTVSSQHLRLMTVKEITMKTITTGRRFSALVAVTLYGAVASIGAMLPAAADSFDAPHVTVKYADLNVSNPQDTAVLYARIRTAAERVCSRYDGHSISAMMEKDACVDKALFEAVTKINNPVLTAVYSSKAGKEAWAHLASLSK
jgi:UrcA family protein